MLHTLVPDKSSISFGHAMLPRYGGSGLCGSAYETEDSHEILNLRCQLSTEQFFKRLSWPHEAPTA